MRENLFFLEISRVFVFLISEERVLGGSINIGLRVRSFGFVWVLVIIYIRFSINLSFFCKIIKLIFNFSRL